MSTIRTILAAAALASLAATAQAATFTYQTIDNPADPTFNQLLGITDTGVIAGYYGNASAGHPNKGYTVAKPYATFTPANAPGSVQTQATGLNEAGYLSGFWSDTNLGPNAQNMNQDANFGFIRQTKNGATLYIDVNNPLVSSQPHVNQLLGINVSGVAVGFYNDANNAAHGYSYSLGTGKFSELKEPHSVVASAATGINKNDLICGFITTAGGRTKGFLRSLSGGSQITFGVPGAMTTQFLGVNDAGQAVGFFIDANNMTHGVIYDPASGTWQAVDAPGDAGGTVLNGLNNRNQIAGFYTDAAGNTHGLLVAVQQ